jgi:hypothetical protein
MQPFSMHAGFAKRAHDGSASAAFGRSGSRGPQQPLSAATITLAINHRDIVGGC